MAEFENDSGSEDRTEEASQAKRDQWRKEGRVPQSREIGPALVLLVCVATLYLSSGYFYQQFYSLFESMFLEMSRISKMELSIEKCMSIFQFSFRALLWIVAPIALVAFFVGSFVGTFQSGFLFTTKPLEPDLSKLNPLMGLKKIFSTNGFFELLKAFVKVGIVGALLYVYGKDWIFEIPGLYDLDSSSELKYLGLKLLRLMGMLGLAMLIVAILDYGFQKFQYEKQIKMTKQEAKEDRKMNEGDPQIRARIRAIQRQVANRRMVEAVKKADVVITNPTHIAVALMYDRENMLAPKVVAKGADFMAQRIKEIARENGIPCVENVPLARALYKALKVGQMISRDLYNAVAEVLAYVYRLRGRTQ